MFIITDNMLKELAASDRVYQKGLAYYRSNRVIDMVIHYDPWWNPAVEDQATDRAYRIGQQNSVQVIKLITKGTIEEKIYALQQKKKAMIDAVIQPGKTLLTKMTEQEVRELFM